MTRFELGDVVKRSDVTADSIPAYRDMRGRIIAVSDEGMVRVSWGPGDDDVLFRNPSTVCLDPRAKPKPREGGFPGKPDDA